MHQVQCITITPSGSGSGLQWAFAMAACSPLLCLVYFLERIMETALENHEGTVSIGGRTITNLHFADDINGLAGTEKELNNLVEKIDKVCETAGMEISAEKTKVMCNRKGGFTQKMKVGETELGEVKTFKYLGAIICEQVSKPEIVNRIAQSTAA